jgi:hypothetical protein
MVDLPINSSSSVTTNKNEQQNRMIEIDTTDLIFPTKPTTITKKTISPTSVVVDDTEEEDDDSSTATETASESEDSSLSGNSSDGSEEWQTTILDTTEARATTTIVQTSSNEVASNRKKVSFGILEFRKYGITLGDHPDCLMGPPVRFSFVPECFRLGLHTILIRSPFLVAPCTLSFFLQVTLDWDYQREHVLVPVDTWEECRPPRRHGDALVMGSRRRQSILRFNGITLEEMKASIADLKRIQKQRRSSYRRSRGTVMERFAAATGGPQGALGGGSCFWLSALLFGIRGGGGEEEKNRNNKNSFLVIPAGISSNSSLLDF